MKKSLVIHPFLFAVFPILFLYAHNIIETPAKQILIPIGASLILALALWAFLCGTIHQGRVLAGIPLDTDKCERVPVHSPALVQTAGVQGQGESG